MILVDANILMYAGGADHQHKKPSLAFLEKAASGELETTIDTEVLQEILHRYQNLKRWDDGKRIFELARCIFPDVVPMTIEVMDRAKLILDADPTLMARDAVHAAVVLVGKMESICSYDSDFDRIPGCKRIEP